MPSVLEFDFASIRRQDVRPTTHKASDLPAFNTIAQAIARYCEADQAIVLWHRNGSAPEEISVTHSGITNEVKQDIEQFVRSLQPAHPSQNNLNVSRRMQTRNGDCIAANWLGDGIVSVTVCWSDSRRGATASRLQSLSLINPLMLPCFEQWLAARKLSARVGMLQSASERSAIATAIVAQDGELIFANRTCRELLEEGQGLFLSNGHLTCSDLAETLHLQAAIAHVLRRSRDDVLDPVMSVARRNRRGIIIALARTNSCDTSGEGEAVLLYLIDPEKCSAEAVEPVCQLYGLSGSEIRLACALVDGLCISEAAKRLRIKQQTARTYLREVFSKTDTSRQAELVKLLLSSAIRMVPNRRMQALAHDGGAPSNGGGDCTRFEGRRIF